MAPALLSPVPLIVVGSAEVYTFPFKSIAAPEATVVVPVVFPKTPVVEPNFTVPSFINVAPL